MKLYGYFRSGTAHRTRLALNLKQLDYEQVSINLAQDEQLTDAFKALNPQGLVPVLKVEDDLLFQSPAILEWLEEAYPEPALLPKDLLCRARVRAISSMIGCDIHPINNRRILQYLRHDLKADEKQVFKWCQQWISEGFKALESLLAQDKSRESFCYGTQPTLADCYLIPQVYSARRFKVDMSAYPNILAIDKHCHTLKAFIDAAPANQADAPQ